LIASAPTIIGSSCPPQGATGGRAQGALACPCLRTRKRWFDGARPQGIRRASGCRRRRRCRCAEHRGVGAGDRDRVDTRPAETTANRNDDEAGRDLAVMTRGCWHQDGATVPSMDVNRNSGAETAVYLPFGTFRASSFLTMSSPAVFGLTLASTSRMRPSGPM
jgi:hypothetical protein